jgi:hypothetical protein
MKRAVNIAVICIDTEYGFTMIQILDHFTGEKLKTFSISSNTTYDIDDIQTITVEMKEV